MKESLKIPRRDRKWSYSLDGRWKTIVEYSRENNMWQMSNCQTRSVLVKSYVFQAKNKNIDTQVSHKIVRYFPNKIKT